MILIAIFLILQFAVASDAQEATKQNDGVLRGIEYMVEDARSYLPLIESDKEARIEDKKLVLKDFKNVIDYVDSLINTIPAENKSKKLEAQRYAAEIHVLKGLVIASMLDLSRAFKEFDVARGLDEKIDQKGFKYKGRVMTLPIIKSEILSDISKDKELALKEFGNIIDYAKNLYTLPDGIESKKLEAQRFAAEIHVLKGLVIASMHNYNMAFEEFEIAKDLDENIDQKVFNYKGKVMTLADIIPEINSEISEYFGKVNILIEDFDKNIKWTEESVTLKRKSESPDDSKYYKKNDLPIDQIVTYAKKNLIMALNEGNKSSELIIPFGSYELISTDEKFWQQSFEVSKTSENIKVPKTSENTIILDSTDNHFSLDVKMGGETLSKGQFEVAYHRVVLDNLQTLPFDRCSINCTKTTLDKMDIFLTKFLTVSKNYRFVRAGARHTFPDDKERIEVENHNKYTLELEKKTLIRRPVFYPFLFITAFLISGIFIL